LKGNSRIYSPVDKELRQVGRYLLRRWKHFNAQDGSAPVEQSKSTVAAE